ncbi:hypothetical protein DSO57_1014500 [Entomophthora muscae]|uniref:Uncharacterized protein n=1 Tax=Entomophthora muscae TaxID=34485 RepID=A0ACC2SI70_9FUNG|nr:hypothetical protein DSO57_1014500 [Entomophthora muscae]
MVGMNPSSMSSVKIPRRSLRNRILSIVYDIKFLYDFHEHFLANLPILALKNQVCSNLVNILFRNEDRFEIIF